MQLIDFITKILKPLIDEYDQYIWLESRSRLIFEEILKIYDEPDPEDIEVSLVERIWIDSFISDPIYFIHDVYNKWRKDRNPSTLYIWLEYKRYSIIKHAIERVRSREA